jgi:hypothetical protein
MRLLPALFAVVTMACAGCVSTDATRIAAGQADDYIPSFKRIPEGYRPVLPYYHTETTFWRCQDFSGAQLKDIQDHFAYPLGEGDYYQHIAAIVIKGPVVDLQLTFTIWLLDGRRLDSGDLSRILSIDDDSYKSSHLGRQMYPRALELLRRAIPESEQKRARDAWDAEVARGSKQPSH